MADPTDVTLPLTTGKIRQGVCAIVEKMHPLPRQENCLPVGDMERELTTYANALVSAAYTDASRDIVRLREELAEAKAKIRAVETLHCWVNEDGKRFIFVADVQAVLGVPVEDEVTSRG